MKNLLILFSVLFFLTFATRQSFAIEDPRSLPNNKVGIHILFPSELADAAHLVNTSGGDWGYIIIPIQSGDKDLDKWQKFMDQARQLHIIPIIRLATEGDYFNTKVWRKPQSSDVLDFANFLNSLNWPTKNRYIVVYNEVNRGDEYGGKPDPTDYAQLLSYAVTVFKSRNQDFFIISAGMDNASANTSEAMNEYTYFNLMNQAVPGIFNQVDGLGSHAYPNPAFSVPPFIHTSESITSFIYERDFIHVFTSKELPTFITETGWSRDSLADPTIGSYFIQAFTTVWNDPNVIAVTPFLLSAGAGPFQNFSFMKSDGSPSAIYNALVTLPKIKGKPTVIQVVLAMQVRTQQTPIEHFHVTTQKQSLQTFFDAEIKNFGKWLLHLE
jgi:hypothetical protein